MKIKHLLTKTLLVAVGLLVGQSVWGVELELYKQNYQTALDASSWSSSDAGALPLNLRTVSENKYIEAGRATNSRYVYTDFFANNADIASTFYGTYTSYRLSFDIILYGGARQPSDFAVMANGHVMPNTVGKNYLQTKSDWASYTNPYLFYLKNAVPDGGSTDDDVKQTFYINETSTTVRMPSDGTWCTIVLDVTETSVNYSIVNKSTSAVLQSGSYVIPGEQSCFAQGIFSFLHKNWSTGLGGDLCIDNILITTEVTGEAVTSPSIAVAYAGANRTVTITPGVSSASNAVTTYYTTDGSDPTSLSSVYSSSPLDIAADCTVKAISISSTSVASAIVSQEVTVGKLQLVAPTLTKTAYSAGKYTISMASNQSGLAYPPASYTNYYSIDGGAAVAYSDPFELNEGSTVTGYVAATNYTNSDEVNLTSAARPTYYATEWTQDYRNVTSAAGTGVQTIGLSDVVFTVDGVDFKNIVSYGSSATAVSLNTNVGLNTNSGVGLRANGANSGIIVNNTNDAKIGIQNLKVGDYIVLYVTGIVPTANYGCTLQDGMSTLSEYYFLATETSASINIPKGVYNYIYTITVLSSTVPATIGTTGYTTFASSYPLNLDGMTASEGTVKAYYVTASDVKSSSVALTDATGNVAAGTGLILEGTAGAAITIPVVASGTDLSSTNMLVGCPTGATITAIGDYANFYVLGATTATFKNIKNYVDTNTSLAIPAGKAYLDTTGSAVPGAPSLTLDLNGEVTGIADVRGKMEDVRSDIFDLQGRKVAQPAKGLYIVNGRKAIIK